MSSGYTRPEMSQSDDLEELARRYVDLWQDQMTALAADPDFAEAMQRVMASLGVTAAGLPAAWTAWPAAMGSMMAAAQPGSARGQAKGQEKDAGTAERAGPSEAAPIDAAAAKPAGPPGAAPAAAASDGGGHDLGLIAQRLAALEERVLALEGGTGGTRRRAKAKAKR